MHGRLSRRPKDNVTCLQRRFVKTLNDVTNRGNYESEIRLHFSEKPGHSPN